MVLGLRQAPVIVSSHAIGVFQQRTHPVPNRLLQVVASDLRIVRHRMAVKPMPIGANAAIIAVHPSWTDPASTAERSCHNRHSRTGDRPSDPAAASAARSTRLACAGGSPAIHLCSFKHGRVNQGRHRNLDPILSRHFHPRTGLVTRIGMTPQGLQ